MPGFDYITWQKRLAGSQTWRVVLATVGVYSLLAYYAAGMWLLTFALGRQVLFEVFVSLALAWVFIFILHFLYPRQRPYQKLNFTPIVTAAWLFSWPHHRPNALPSEHVTCLAAVSLAAFWTFPFLGLAGLVLAAIVGAARVVLGYHYSGDIFAGLAAGALAAVATHFWLFPLLLHALR